MPLQICPHETFTTETVREAAASKRARKIVHKTGLICRTVLTPLLVNVLIIRALLVVRE